MIPPDYSRWQADRRNALTAEDGWLNLTDRFEILPGPQTTGAAPDNAIRLSSGPAHLGTLLPGFQFQTQGGQPQPFVSRKGNPELRVGTFLLEIHTVEGQPALRVRDLTLARHVDLRYFPYDPAWKIRARWQALASPKPQVIDQKGAAPTTITLTHHARFDHNGAQITLLATHWKSGLPMFVIRDATSGCDTYPASRFLIGEDVTDNALTLDFNRAHNPPCAFTDFAICPLPPRQNILPFRVAAGELGP